MRSIQCLAKQPSEIFGLSQFDQSPERSIGIGGCRVDQQAGLVPFSIHLRVYPFPDAGGIVATFQGQLPDQHVRQGMEHDVACSGIALSRIEISLLAPSAMAHAQACIDLFDRILIGPGSQSFGVKADEDTFAVNLRRRHPIGRRTSQWSARRCVVTRSFVRGLDAGEAEQGIHLAQSFQEQDARDRGFESFRNSDLCS